MGNIYCVKCGAEFFGKCPKCRHSFVEDEYNLTEKQLSCDHELEYKESQLKCIYGCGYVSPLVYAGQF